LINVWFATPTHNKCHSCFKNCWKDWCAMICVEISMFGSECLLRIKIAVLWESIFFRIQATNNPAFECQLKVIPLDCHQSVCKGRCFISSDILLVVRKSYVLHTILQSSADSSFLSRANSVSYLVLCVDPRTCVDMLNSVHPFSRHLRQTNRLD